MAGLITHVYIAEKLLEDNLLTVKDINSYILGSLAPDAIMSKENYHRDDKKNSHLRKGISSDNWYLDEFRELFNTRIKEYYEKYLKSSKDSFALGYLVHLLTDQAFHYTFRLDIIDLLKEKNLSHTGRDLLNVMNHELDTLDYKLLEMKRDILDTIILSKSVCNNSKIGNLIDSDSLCKNFDWINSKYNLEDIEKSNFMYFDVSDISYLVSNVSNQVIEALKNLGI